MTSITGIRTETLSDARSFVRYWDEIDALRREVGAKDDVLQDPLHFLAATDDTRRSCSVACWEGDALIGLVYATQHYVRGVATGFSIGGDYVGRGLLLSHREREAAVIKASIEKILSGGVHSLHLRVLRRTDEKTPVPGTRMKYLDAVVPGDRMILTGSFDEFLGTLGKHTRRNIRNYIRKAASAGIGFVPSLTREEYEAGVHRLNTSTAFPVEEARLLRDERLLAFHSGSQRMGLRDEHGNWVAILCGFSQKDRFHLLTQLNDVGFEHLSLSVVLRGRMVESLISSGHAELQFMGGTSLSFGRFCAPQRYRSIFIDKQRGLAAVAKHLGSRTLELMARMGRPIPKTLEMICSGYLEEWRLMERTAVGPAAVAFGHGRPGVTPTAPPELSVEHESGTLSEQS
jgi:hypothetical protein